MTKANPFRPGAGKVPPYLAGRKDERAVFAGLLHQLQEGKDGNEIVLYGPRGVGKTVLLMWLKEQCKEQGVLAVKTTPSELEHIGNLPGLLLPASWWPKAVTLNVKNFLNVVWADPKTGTARNFAQHLTTACRKKPRVLLLDEAHTLKRKHCRKLLNLSQTVTSEAPFALILAGTPGLRSYLMSVEATFIERAEKVGISLLDETAAAAAISKPLHQSGISIEPAALQKVVADAQCYPYFLQEWGKVLWERAHRVKVQGNNTDGTKGGTGTNQPQPATLTEADLLALQPTVHAKRRDFYAGRFEAFGNNPELRAAANVVAEVFQNTTSIDQTVLKKIITNSLGDTLTDPGAREIKATALVEELKRIDFIWQPPLSSEAVPGIPSFMSYTRAECKKLAQN